MRKPEGSPSRCLPAGSVSSISVNSVGSLSEENGVGGFVSKRAPVQIKTAQRGTKRRHIIDESNQNRYRRSRLLPGTHRRRAPRAVTVIELRRDYSTPVRVVPDGVVGRHSRDRRDGGDSSRRL